MESVRRRGKHTSDEVIDEKSAVEEERAPTSVGEINEDDVSYLRHLLPEALLGYIWWSTFFSLAPTIWYFPLNLLEISGYEAFAVLSFSPIFTLIPFIDKFVTSRNGMKLFQTLTVIGILCYHAPTAIIRLVVTSLAVFFAMLWLAGALWCQSKLYRELVLWGLTVGFFLKLVLRIAFTSLNPMWTSSSNNLIIFSIGIICVIDRNLFLSNLRLKSKAFADEKEKPLVSTSAWVTVALGTGSWLFIVQWLFAEVSVLSRYTGGAIPSSSVAPIPGGIFTLIALFIGIALSSQQFVTSSWWWIFGGLSAVAFYQAPPIAAYFGGLGIAVYTMSLFPRIITQLTRCNKSKCLTLALVTCIVLLLASVWVVAYNFVPGGVFTRERNDIILAASVILIGLAVAVDVDNESEVKASKRNSGTPFFSTIGNRETTIYKHGVLPVLFVLLFIGAMATTVRHRRREEKRQAAKDLVRDHKQFTSLIWTVHFGYDNQGWHSFERSTQLLRDSGADVIGILESDCSRPYVGSTDLVSYLEEHLGFYSDYGPKTKDHTWGAAILSRYPIVKSTHYLLPSPEGELAPALLASVNISGQIIDFVVVHMGNDKDDLDRQLQAEELARILDASKNPVVFLGYVTSAPSSRDYLKLLDEGRTKDIDYEDTERWCEYIFYRDLMRTGYARVSHGGLSDTELQLAKFRVPKNISNFHDNDGLTTTGEDVEEESRFPEAFGDFHIGNYHGEGHHYHMATPRYFVPTQ